MILLDTDTCIEVLRGNQRVIDRRKRVDDKVAISFMTIGELYYGAEKSINRNINLVLVDEFILSTDVIQSDLEILKKFGELKAELRMRGQLLPDADCFIAATCLSKCKKLVTGNTRLFNRIENLVVENWIR